MISSSPLRHSNQQGRHYLSMRNEQVELKAAKFSCPILIALNQFNECAEKKEVVEALNGKVNLASVLEELRSSESNLRSFVLNHSNNEYATALMADAAVLSPSTFVRRAAFKLLQELNYDKALTMHQVYDVLCKVADVAEKAGTIPEIAHYEEAAALIQPLISNKAAVLYLCKYMQLGLWGNRFLAEPLSRTTYRQPVLETVKTCLKQSDQTVNAMFLGVRDVSFVLEALNPVFKDELKFLMSFVESQTVQGSNYENAALRTMGKVSIDKNFGSWLYSIFFSSPNRFDSALMARRYHSIAEGISNNLTETIVEELTKFLHLNIDDTHSFIIGKELLAAERFGHDSKKQQYVPRKIFGLLPIPLWMGGVSARQQGLRAKGNCEVSDYRICAAIALEKHNPKLATDVLLQETSGGDSWKAKGSWFVHNYAINGLKRLGKIPTNESDFVRAMRDATGVHFEEHELKRWLEDKFGQ
jgi:hypothetical protein